MKDWVKQLLAYELYEKAHPAHRLENLRWLQWMRNRYRQEEARRVNHPRTQYPIPTSILEYAGECQRCENTGPLEIVTTGQGLRTMRKHGTPTCRFLCHRCAKLARAQQRRHERQAA